MGVDLRRDARREEDEATLAISVDIGASALQRAARRKRHQQRHRGERLQKRRISSLHANRGECVDELRVSHNMLLESLRVR